jgi:hypothetical protein
MDDLETAARKFFEAFHMQADGAELAHLASTVLELAVGRFCCGDCLIDWMRGLEQEMRPTRH